MERLDGGHPVLPEVELPRWGWSPGSLKHSNGSKPGVLQARRPDHPEGTETQGVVLGTIHTACLMQK